MTRAGHMPKDLQLHLFFSAEDFLKHYQPSAWWESEVWVQVLADRDGKETIVSNYCLVLDMEKDLVVLLDVTDCSYSHSTILCF